MRGRGGGRVRMRGRRWESKDEEGGGGGVRIRGRRWGRGSKNERAEVGE